MRRLGIGMTATFLAAGLLSHPGCKAPELPHEVGDPTYELKGKHQPLVCEQCHGPIGGCLGEGRPEAQSQSCKACHTEDAPRNHFVGQECFPCHTEAGWTVSDPLPTGDTGVEPDPTGDTGTPPEPEPDPDHDGLLETKLCWDCHLEDRPALHWVDVPRQGLDWDCAGCHVTDDWTKFTEYVDRDHPVHLPHGTWNNQNPIFDEGAWVVACADCHTDSPPYKAFQCMEGCHSEIAFDPDEDHQGFLTGDDQLGCLECHVNGDYWGATP